MKRLIVSLTACLLIASSAAADAVPDFNLYAEIFGAHEISNGIESVIDSQDVLDFTSDGCRIVFASENEKLNSIIIVGIGDKFLAYCAAAIMMFDKQSENRTTNYGQLLTTYLLALGDSKGEEHIGSTVSGAITSIKQEGDQYRFIILAVN